MFSTFAIYDKSFIVVVVFFFMPSHSQDLMWELMNGCSEDSPNFSTFSLHVIVKCNAGGM